MTGPVEATEDHPVEDVEAVGGIRFWAGALVGSALMAWGVWLFLGEVSRAEARWGLVVWIVGLDLAHDLLLAPVVLAVGVVVARLAPRALRAPLHVGLVASAFVLALAVLPLAGTASATGNPTIQPLDYRTSTATALALVWGAVGVVSLVHWSASRRRRS